MTILLPRDKSYLRIKVIPKSGKTAITEIMNDPDGEQTIKISLKAAPEKGRANVELIRFLSKTLQVPTENISILSGATSRLKLVKIKYES